MPKSVANQWATYDELPNFSLRGRSNGYAWDVERAFWISERKNKPCAWEGCDALILPQSTYCYAHRPQVRGLAHDDEIADIHPRYLQPTPEGMELIWYPGRAGTSERSQAREQIRKRLRMYFEREKRVQVAGLDSDNTYSNVITT